MGGTAFGLYRLEEYLHRQALQTEREAQWREAVASITEVAGHDAVGAVKVVSARLADVADWPDA